MKMRNVPIAGVAFALTALARLPQTTGGDFLEVEIIKASASQEDCLRAFNSARAAAGFKPFVQNKTDLFVKDHATAQDFINMGCKALRTLSLPPNFEKFNATIAVTLQEGQRADCDEAAAQIQKARHNFNSPPGPYIKNAPPFDEMENISLVALYNPKENAELDCYYLSCLQDEDSSNPIRVRGLICASSPVALEQGKQPFTQEEFTRIETAEAFARSAASLVPIASMVAAVAACMLLAFE